MKEILDFVKKINYLIEDCCESMGAKYNNVEVGNFGLLSSFSLYYSHHYVHGRGIVLPKFELAERMKIIYFISCQEKLRERIIILKN